MLKKFVLLLMFITLLFSPIRAYALSDISGHWAKNDIALLNEKGIISGYSDLSFKPNNYIKRDEFICIVVRLIKDYLGENKFIELMNSAYADLKPGEEEFYKVYEKQELPSNYWAINIIRQSVYLRILPYKSMHTSYLTTSDLKCFISREEAAYILDKASHYFGLYADKMLHNYAKENISDLSNSENYQDQLLNCYVLGIFNGYSDGSLKGKKLLTRAEAAATLVKLYDLNRLQQYTPKDTPFVFLNNVSGPLKSLRYYPPKVNNKVYYDFLHLVKTLNLNIDKSLGYVKFTYNPINAILGLEFYNTEDDYKALINSSSENDYYHNIPYTLYMTLTISPYNLENYPQVARFNKIRSRYNPYLLVTWGNNFNVDILEKHSEFLKVYFNYLFKAHGESIYNKFEQYMLTGDGGLTTYSELNGRYTSWKPIGKGIVIIETMELN